MLERFCALGIVLALVMAQLAWLVSDLTIPVADAGAHFRVAILTYQAFGDGFFEGLQALWMPSAGKPILFSAFAAPIMLFTNMDPLLTTDIFLHLVFLGTMFAIFWSFQYYVRPLYAASLTLLYGSMPFVFNMSTIFMTEIGWSLWFWLFVGSFVRSALLSNNRYAFLAGLFLVFCILARPIEPIAILLVPLLTGGFVIGKQFEQRKSTFRFLASLCVGFIVILSGLGLSLASVRLGRPALVSLVLVAVVAAVSGCMLRSNSPLDRARLQGAFCFCSPIIFISFLWLFYNGNQMYSWAFTNTFGSTARINDQVYLGENVFFILWDMVSSYGLLAFSTLAVLATLNAYASKQWKHLGLILFASLVVLAPILVGYSVSGTSDDRRIMLSMSILFFGVGVFIFRKSPKALAQVSFALLSVIGVFQLSSIPMTSHSSLKYFAGTLKHFKPLQEKPVNFEILKNLEESGLSSNAKIAVYSLSQFKRTLAAIDAEVLSYAALINGDDYEFSTLWGYSQYESMEAVINRLVKNRYDYVLLDATGVDREEVDFVLPVALNDGVWASHTFFVNQVISAINQYKANAISGLELVNQFAVGGKSLYLFKPMSKQDPVYIGSDSTNPDFSLDKLFDGNNRDASFWEPLHKSGAHLYFAFTKPKTLEGLQLTSGTEETGRMPTSVDMWASDDAQSWEYFSVAIEEPWGENDIKMMRFASPVTARYYKFHMGSRHLLRMYELDIVSDTTLSGMKAIVMGESFLSFTRFLSKANDAGV